jgi:hypothetical protein
MLKVEFIFWQPHGAFPIITTTSVALCPWPKCETPYKIGKLNMWTVFCNVMYHFFEQPNLWKTNHAWIEWQASECYHILKPIFPSKTWVFGIYLNFQRQTSLKNQPLHHMWAFTIIYHIKMCKPFSHLTHTHKMLDNVQWAYVKCHQMGQSRSYFFTNPFEECYILCIFTNPNLQFPT